MCWISVTLNTTPEPQNPYGASDCGRRLFLQALPEELQHHRGVLSEACAALAIKRLSPVEALQGSLRGAKGPKKHEL